MTTQPANAPAPRRSALRILAVVLLVINALLSTAVLVAVIVVGGLLVSNLQSAAQSARGIKARVDSFNQRIDDFEKSVRSTYPF